MSPLRNSEVNEDATTSSFEPEKTIVLEADEAKDGRVTPLRAVRRHCLWCCNGNPNEVRLCVSKSCPLWPFRLGHRPTAEFKTEVGDRVLHPAERQITGKAFHDAGGTTLRAIRLRCLGCSGASPYEVAGCRHTDCDLHAFRFGKATRNYSDEVRAKKAELARALSAKRHSLPENDDSASDPDANA
jgi:hypothetical protein